MGSKALFEGLVPGNNAFMAWQAEFQQYVLGKRVRVDQIGHQHVFLVIHGRIVPDLTRITPMISWQCPGRRVNLVYKRSFGTWEP